MADDRADEQLLRLQQAFAVHDAHTLAIRLGVDFAQLRRWQDGASIPRLMFMRAADLTGHPADWLACMPGAQPRAVDHAALTHTPGLR